MRAYTLLLLRVSLGLLLVIWGVDKLVDSNDALAISQRFYREAFSNPLGWHILGALQALLGAAVVVGLWRKFTYPLQALVNGASLLGVWESILDPWGWVLQEGNMLFFPSLIIFAACLVLWAFQADDRMCLDRRR
ncbi:hypothetical protein Maes01_02456 [Microbulbifer aestuariivivens]|uniref:DoxX family membrane protein n=1 Tax=Microbulbifer aestuariivivens TaxID=1908308 RepID=A0ABP9WTG2_9GAMM